MTMRILTELKARKAKFGFKKDSVRVEDFIPPSESLCKDCKTPVKISLLK
jgi:transposase